MSVQITINGENAAQAIQEFSALSAAFVGGSPVAPAQPVAPAAPNAPFATNEPQNAQPAAPVYQQPAQTQPSAQAQATVPTQPQQPAQTFGAVPTTAAPAYTVEQLGVAAGPLLDAGRAGELTAWLNQKGASFLHQLDPSLYGEFATYLRSLGAKI